ncbi:MAG TPA: hypothetical protein VH120_16705, partial [Gemmataceae bacterium]|nr:hypothetical protein [Gemmataceae bacterium]
MARATSRWIGGGLLGALLLPAVVAASADPLDMIVPTDAQFQDPTVRPAQYPPIPTPDAFPPARPDVLNRPIGPLPPPGPGVETPLPEILGPPPILPPLGYTGCSGVLPTVRPDRDYVPMEDRWRLGFPAWDRYKFTDEYPYTPDYPYQLGHWWDPFNQSVFKGDYPIIGQHTFLNITGIARGIFEGRQLPTQTTPFESTARPFEQEFFGRPNQAIYSQYLLLSFDLFHGDASFKPVDWRIKLTPAFNYNSARVEELAQISPDVTDGQHRDRTWFTLEEYFVEAKLFDLSPEYDFASVRIGSQFFVSDFRGFIFADTNRAVRLFGTENGNRDQFNVIYLRPAEKDTNSGLNTMEDRRQNLLIANWYHQDFIWPGYTIQGSVHYDDDEPSFLFDKNRFLVRPDPDGVFQPHRVEATYFGLTGDGHIDRYNITHAFYWVVGHDSQNPLANCPQDINAQMAAVELSYDRDWARFRGSFFWASGDGNINNHHATGFDTINDSPNFAGGEFSFWQRQNIPIFGVNLVQRQSIVPDLRSSKIQGQANFVNPGLFLVNTGIDFELTPRLRMINNCNFLWFDDTDVLKQFLFTGQVRNYIGVDLSSGFEYRPLLSNNAIITCGISGLIPGQGFKDIYNS